MNAARSACVVAALGAVAYLLLDPATADHAAQEYRAGLVTEAGLGLWDNGWFAGHHTPAYSLLSPGLGALLGVRLAGALAAVAAAALFGLLAERQWGATAGRVAAVWFAIGVLAQLVSGRLTFLLGVAIGLGSLLALQRGFSLLACALAALTTLASPVAGLFLAVAALARAITTPRTAALLFVAALAPAAILALLFPEGGTEPFVASAFWPALVAIALVVVALPARERTLRIAAGIYALTCVAAFAFATPLGGNVTRLGALAAGPVLAGALLALRPRQRPPILLVALALPLAYWQLYPAARDVVRASGDPSTAAAYHAPLSASSTAGPARSASRSRSPRTTGKPRTSRRTSRSRAAGSASSTAATARSSTPARSPPRPTAPGSTSTPSPTSPCRTCRSTTPRATRRSSSPGARRTSARSGAQRTGASSPSGARRRSSAAPRGRSSSSRTASRCAPDGVATRSCGCATRAGGPSPRAEPASSAAATA